MHRSTGAPEHQGTLIYSGENNLRITQTSQSSGAPVHRSTGAPEHRCTGIFPREQMLKLSEQPTTFKHPFTMTVSGPTGSGKTWLIKDIFRHNIIFPAPQRVLILFKRWQPLYDEIKKIIPYAEFIQGIPTDLDHDDFFDVAKNNLILMDDLQSTTANDPRIADLFTEGSHHRNLSVINLTQTLFPPGKNSATLRRNTQYMIIFKSPMSQDQVKTLGTFMFPGRLDQFLRVFNEATSKPHGYLVIDAKQSTPEYERFKTDIIQESIKGSEHILTDHYIIDCQRDNTEGIKQQILSDYPDENRDLTESIKGDAHTLPAHSITDCQSEHISTNKPDYSPSDCQSEHNLTDINMASCDDCGIMFENVHDLQRHVKCWCPEMHQPIKKAKIEIDPEDDKEALHFTTEAEVPVFHSLMENASEENEDELDQKVRKYRQQGMDKNEALDKALFKMRTINLNSFIALYTRLIHDSLQLSKGLIHNQIIEAINDYKKKGYSEKVAVSLAVNQYKNHLENVLWAEEGESDDESETDESEASEEESDEIDDESESEDESDQEDE